jgi:CBS domain-containing protein
MRVGELCTRTVVIARGDEKVVEAGQRMRTAHVGTLVVVEERDGTRHPLGIVTDRDLLFAVVGTSPGHAAELKLAEVMTWDLVTAREEEDVNVALDRMRAHGVRRIVVVDARGALAGILAYDDLVEWVAEQLGELSQLVTSEERRERGLHR